MGLLLFCPLWRFFFGWGGAVQLGQIKGFPLEGKNKSAYKYRNAEILCDGSGCKKDVEVLVHLLVKNAAV